jgi:hypothetical protein
VQRLIAVRSPVLALAGGASPAWAADAARAIADAVPSGRAEIVPDQDHNPAAQVLAPLLTEALL